MNSTVDNSFEVKTDGMIDIQSNYLTDAIESVEIPGEILIKDYMQWYWNYNYEGARSDKELNYDKFMEFSYELSEKAAPFLHNCDLENEELCKEFHNEVNK